MEVSLKAYKSELASVKKAIAAEPLGDVRFVQLKADRDKLWIGGRSAAVSYNRSITYTGDANFRAIYVPLSAADAMPKNTKDDVLELLYAEGSLLFKSSAEQGLVETVTGLQYAAPFDKKEQSVPYMVLRSGTFLKSAIALAKNVKQGWTSKTKPYSADFIRLVLSEDQDEPVVRFLLSDLYADGERGVAYYSGTALSVFSSDGAKRYYQSFEPVFKVYTPDLRKPVSVVSTWGDEQWLGVNLHLTIKDADVLSKIVNDAEYYINLIKNDSGVPDAMVLFNGDTTIWVRLALDTYPDLDFNEQLAFFHGTTVAQFVPTKDFITSVKAAINIAATGKHGLTVVGENDILKISSPEDAVMVRFDSTPATIHESFTTIVDGAGFLSAIDSSDEVTLVHGEGFLAIYNPAAGYRVILRTFTR